MAKFTFKLEALLRVRRTAEQSMQRDVATINRDRLRLEELLRNQQSHISTTKQTLQHSLVGNVDCQVLRMHAASTMDLMRHAQRLVLELAGVHRRLDVARQNLIEAARQRRAIEILRERRLAQWNARLRTREDNEIDELATIAAFGQTAEFAAVSVRSE